MSYNLAGKQVPTDRPARFPSTRNGKVPICGDLFIVAEVLVMGAKMGHHIALYGSIALERAVCPRCKRFSFVLEEEFVCCGYPCRTIAAAIIRTTEAPQVRRRPKKKDQARILDRQGNRCFYCGVEFGTWQSRNDEPFEIRINWDHAMPYKLTQNNMAFNFVAACHVCNAIKYDSVFSTPEEARIALAKRRAELGFDY